MDDKNLDGGAGEGAEDLELELSEEEKGTGGDPLDDIQDPVARAEAKKYRAIARRNAKKEEKPHVPEVKPDSSSEFLTKADFQKSNERKATLLAQADPEVKANWAEIVPFYHPRRGRETPEDILEDIKDAIILYNARNPKGEEKDNGIGGLIATPVVKTGGAPAKNDAEKPKDPPNFHLPKQPKDWYPKAEAK